MESGCGDRFVKDAKLDSKPIGILLDTGSKMSIVRADLVSQARWKMDDRMPIQCVHGDQLAYPTADVLLEVDGWSRVLKVAVVPQMPVDMIVGADDCPDGILSSLSCKSLMVTTRSQSKKMNTVERKLAIETSENPSESKVNETTSRSTRCNKK